MNVDRDLVRVVAPPLLAACVVALLVEVPEQVPDAPPRTPASAMP